MVRRSARVAAPAKPSGLLGLDDDVLHSISLHLDVQSLRSVKCTSLRLRALARRNLTTNPKWDARRSLGKKTFDLRGEEAIAHLSCGSDMYRDVCQDHAERLTTWGSGEVAEFVSWLRKPPTAKELSGLQDWADFWDVAMAVLMVITLVEEGASDPNDAGLPDVVFSFVIDLLNEWDEETVRHRGFALLRTLGNGLGPFGLCAGFEEDEGIEGRLDQLVEHARPHVQVALLHHLCVVYADPVLSIVFSNDNYFGLQDNAVQVQDLPALLGAFESLISVINLQVEDFLAFNMFGIDDYWAHTNIREVCHGAAGGIPLMYHYHHITTASPPGGTCPPLMAYVLSSRARGCFR